jgi:flavin reductase (DIM6/NTAB) family NADH-FMN oxidoreductase RutF
MTTTPPEGKTMGTAHATPSRLDTAGVTAPGVTAPGVTAQGVTAPGVTATDVSAQETSGQETSAGKTSAEEIPAQSPSAQSPPAAAPFAEGPTVEAQAVEGLATPVLVPAEGFRQAIAKLPTGVTVLTTVTGDSPVGCTANAVMSLSADTPSVLVSLGTHSRTLAAILDTGSFAVNTLSWSQRALTRKFASGSPAERFAGVPWRPERRIPVLSAAGVALVCEVGDTAALLDHTVVVGKVVWLRDTNEAPTVLYGREQYPLGA